MLRTYSQTRIALGSDVTLQIVADEVDETRILQLFNLLWVKIYKFEKRFSRFLPNSELTQFNINAGFKRAISEEFYEILKSSVQMSSRTNRLFNPFILPALQRAGYVKSFVPGYENDDQIDFSDRRVAAMDELSFGRGWAKIPYSTALDFGGIGKGFLADKLAELMAYEPVQGYWFSLGGDVVGAGFDETGKPWQVEIADSFESGNEKVSIQTDGKKFAVATSGTQLRKGIFHGKAWHHILNPKTLLPAETDIYLATVHGKTGVETDVYASAAVLLGSVEALAFAKEQPSIQSAVVHGIGGGEESFRDWFGDTVILHAEEGIHVA